MQIKSQNWHGTLVSRLPKALRSDPLIIDDLRKQVEARLLADQRQAQRACYDGSLYNFVVDGWKVLEPHRPMKTGWMLKEMCKHLEAATRGEITHLLINLPPGTLKSLLLNVFWPAWEWGPANRPDLRYLCVAYNQKHARRDGRRMRLLVESEWYQGLYGDRVQLTSHADEHFENTSHGFRKSRSIDSVTGERADRVLIDDPHNVGEAESEARRTAVVQNFTENILTRVNDPEESAIVLIMQRVHEKDVSGEILRRGLDFVHLCLPMLFDPERRCTNPIFTDPRSTPGELLFPERFSVASIERAKKQMGDYAFSAQMQQLPISREGNWFKRASFILTDQAPPKIVRFVMTWDLAATEPRPGRDPDYTVALLTGIDEAGNIWVVEMYRFRESPGQAQTLIADIVNRAGSDVTQVFPRDPGGAGVYLEDSLKRLLSSHYNLKFVIPRGSKDARSHEARVAAELRRVRLCAFADRDTFLDEVCAFPSGAHDDIVDAFGDAVRELQSKKTIDYSSVGEWSDVSSFVPLPGVPWGSW